MSDDILQQQNKVSKKSIEFEQIFETFLVHIIFNYFLHNGQYSNQVPELCNLMLCNRSTNESMTVRFLKHGKFNMSNFKFWEKDKIRLLRNICIDKDSLRNFNIKIKIPKVKQLIFG